MVTVTCTYRDTDPDPLWTPTLSMVHVEIPNIWTEAVEFDSVGEMKNAWWDDVDGLALLIANRAATHCPCSPITLDKIGTLGKQYSSCERPFFTSMATRYL